MTLFFKDLNKLIVLINICPRLALNNKSGCEVCGDLGQKKSKIEKRDKIRPEYSEVLFLKLSIMLHLLLKCFILVQLLCF